MFMWMLKHYKDKKKAKQSGRWSKLVYESTSFDGESGIMTGNWFYKGFETNPQYSGRWKLELEPKVIDCENQNRQIELGEHPSNFRNLTINSASLRK